MKSSEKRMSAGWSFAAGAVFGGLLVFVPLASVGGTGPRAEGSKQHLALAARSIERASAPTEPASAKVSQSDLARRAPANPKKIKSRSSGEPNGTRHSELDLQLD